MKTKIILLPLLLLLFACEKEPATTATIPNEVEQPGIPLTEYLNTNATLQATYHSSIADSNLLGKVTVFKGYGKAVFRNGNHQIKLPRRVAVEGTVLTSEKGYYTNYPGKSTGIDFGSSVNWEITGRGSEIPSFNNEVMYKVPEIGDVSVEDSIQLENELVMNIAMKSPFTDLGSGIDSVKYAIYGPNGVIRHKMPGLDAVLFTTSEINSLGSGSGYIEVEAYSVEVKDYNGYRVAFINKGVFHKKVALHY